MRSVEVVAVGKVRDKQITALCDVYYRRFRKLKVSRHVVASNDDLLNRVERSRARLVLLDEHGEQPSSIELARRVEGWLLDQSQLTFAIGGADGFDDALRKRADYLLAFGRLTIAHRLVHLLFAEQLYRIETIIEGLPYHREG